MAHRQQPQLRIELRYSDQFVVVTPHGDIDVATAPLLRAALHEVVWTGTSPIVVDLGDVPFLDSSALGVLVGARGRSPHTHTVHLVTTRPFVLSLLAIAGLDQLLCVHSSLELAVAAARDAFPGPRRQGGIAGPGVSGSLL
jgi:anti-sigma B factor antagonist